MKTFAYCIGTLEVQMQALPARNLVNACYAFQYEDVPVEIHYLRGKPWRRPYSQVDFDIHKVVLMRSIADNDGKEYGIFLTINAGVDISPLLLPKHFGNMLASLAEYYNTTPGAER